MNGDEAKELRLLLSETKRAVEQTEAIVAKMRKMLRDQQPLMARYIESVAKRMIEVESGVHALNNLGMAIEAALYREEHGHTL